MIPAQLRFLGGREAGRVVRLRSEMAIGRDPNCQIQVGPDQSTVSALHARVSWHVGSWQIADLGSRNGTWINGERVSGPRPLALGDEIVLGRNGPRLRFESQQEAHASGHVRGQGHRRWILPTMMGMVLGVAAATLGYLSNSLSNERTALPVPPAEDRLEEQVAERAALQRQVAGLETELATAESALARMQRQLDDMSNADDEEVDQLRRELQDAEARVDRQRLAANLDFALLEQVTGQAVAKVIVDFGGGEIIVGTGFLANAQGILVTNRHVVHGPDGERKARRIAVQFVGSTEAHSATVAVASRVVDVALLSLDELSRIPAPARALDARADALQPGTPLALIGFPLGGGAARDSDLRVARAVVSAGILEQATADLLVVQGYGAEGSSGSPLVDESGTVVGVLMGASAQDPSKLLAVPTIHALDLIRAVRR